MQLVPDQPEVEAALALLLLTHARTAARTGPDGRTLPPAQQDRSLRNPAESVEGRQLLDRPIARRAPGPFQIKAAIAALHSEDSGSDWPQIAAPYARLYDAEPTPVIALNHAVALVALAECGRVAQALAQVEALTPELDGYQPFHAVRADLCARSGQTEPARVEYARAIALAQSPADRSFLEPRLALLG